MKLNTISGGEEGGKAPPVVVLLKKTAKPIDQELAIFNSVQTCPGFAWLSKQTTFLIDISQARLDPDLGKIPSVKTQIFFQ